MRTGQQTIATAPPPRRTDAAHKHPNARHARGDTIREAIARAQKFIAEHPLQGVKFRLAGGFIGTTAALNEEIDFSEKRATLLVILTVFVLVAISYASFTAGGMVMLTLIAAGVVSYMYIIFEGIGMNINSLPVTAVGMGIGVDYILYVVDRIRLEVPRVGGDWKARENKDVFWGNPRRAKR